MYKQLNIILLSITIIAFLLPSCDDEDEPVKTPDQLFQPAMFRQSVSSNTVKFTWVPIGHAKYSLDVSLTQDFSSGVVGFVIEKSEEFVVENLLSNTAYWARIKCVSTDGSLKDSQYNTLTFTTQQENIIYAPKTGDVGIDYVKLSWDSVRVVTNITVTKGTDAAVNYVLTAAEKEHGKKEFSGLLANTKYTFKIYNGDSWLRGTRDITTATENIFKAITPDKIGLDHVLLQWDNAKPSDKIVVSASGKTDVTIPVTAAESEKDITGLSPETTYTFKIYNGSVLRGTVTAKTLTDYSGNILFAPAAGDIGETFVTLKWNTNAFDVTHIMVSTSNVGAKDTKITLTADDIKNHLKKIEGLTKLTVYTFRIYNGDNLRGEAIVTTL